MRKLTDFEVEFWNGYSIGILIDTGMTMNINDGKISEIGNDNTIDTSQNN